jgi:hypothetical protein
MPMLPIAAIIRWDSLHCGQASSAISIHKKPLMTEVRVTTRNHAGALAVVNLRERQRTPR